VSSTPLVNLTNLSTLRLAEGAEISGFHSSSKLVFTIGSNPAGGGSNKLSVVDLSNPATPSLKELITLTSQPNSVAVSSSGLVAVAVEGAGAARYTEGKGANGYAASFVRKF
jgi:hypothetical protein